ncbi:renalase [Abditibacteriota bacterium]|nr:renalase [Abditibacteriota bacterium]
MRFNSPPAKAVANWVNNDVRVRQRRHPELAKDLYNQFGKSHRQRPIISTENCSKTLCASQFPPCSLCLIFIMATILILGAGLSGLSAARQLQEQGHEVTIVDKGRGIGGRMATRRFEGGIFDHGAQFFTVRSEAFQAELEKWESQKVVGEWFQGFPTPDNRKPDDHYPRFRGTTGMTGIGKYLAQDLNVHLSTEIAALSYENGGWTAKTASGESFSSEKLLLTAPVPQSLALLATSGVSLPTQARETLQSLHYEPCFALLVQLEKPSAIPAPGAFFVEGETIYWIADNSQKGISSIAGSVTIHSSGTFAKQHYNDSEATVASLLLDATKQWLGSEPKSWQLRRWRYSKPENPINIGALHVPELNVCFAGDALNGAKIEGAFTSGLKAADLLG